MVFLVDDGSVFDAPRSLVWEFVGSGDRHSEAHGHVAVDRAIVDGRCGRYSWVQPFDGRPTRFVMEWTAFPPLGIAYRVLEGPFAGSTFFLYYRDLGERTAVSLVGDFQSPTLGPEELPGAVERFLAREFEQDADALRRLANGRPASTAPPSADALTLPPRNP